LNKDRIGQEKKSGILPDRMGVSHETDRRALPISEMMVGPAPDSGPDGGDLEEVRM